MDKKVKSVTLYFPNSEDSTCVYYEVGKSEVTKIEEAEKNGEYAKILYYEIYKGENLVAEMHHFSVVEYMPEDKSELPINLTEQYVKVTQTGINEVNKALGLK
jgi:hypothetical protein